MQVKRSGIRSGQLHRVHGPCEDVLCRCFGCHAARACLRFHPRPGGFPETPCHEPHTLRQGFVPQPVGRKYLAINPDSVLTDERLIGVRHGNGVLVDCDCHENNGG